MNFFAQSESWGKVTFAALLALFLASAAPALAQETTTISEPLSQAEFSQLTSQERADLLSRLSDEQVRDLMLTYIESTAAPAAATPPVLEEINQEIGKFRAGFGERLSHVGMLPMLPAFAYDRLAKADSPNHALVVLGLFAGTALIAFVVQRGYRRGARRLYDGLGLPPDAAPLKRLERLFGRMVLDLIGVAVFAVTVLIVFFLLYHGHEPTRLTVLTLLAALVVVSVISVVSRFFFAPYQPNLRIAPFDDAAALSLHRWIMAAAIIATFGIMIAGLLLDLGANPIDVKLMLNLLGLVVVAVLIAGAVRLRRPVAAALAQSAEGDGYQHRFLGMLASFWHVAFIAYVVILFVLGTYKGVVGGDMASYPGLLSLLIVLLLPAVDFFLRALLDRVFPTGQDEHTRGAGHALPVFKRAMRALLIVLAIILLGEVWGVDFFALGQGSVGEEVMRSIVEVALTLLVAYVVWGVVKAALTRHMAPEPGDAAHGADEGGGASVSRLHTVMPLILRFVQISLAVMVVMILLSSLGVNIGPMLAGAGVIGLAVGFGAQSLVRDIVSGVFFLMDDAFRKGEYVDIGSVKGTVESINVRSLVLRHHLGVLHTVPYGEIQHLSNFSRDWVIVKMEFRVPTDTDINKVKKIFKQIGVDMLENPELGKDFLEPFKSQGVKAIEDSAIIVRGKFMSRPGKQFVIRKELYNQVQQRFHENGIAFAHRKVTVELPPDLKLTGEQAEQVRQAAGAAVIAAEEAEEAENKAKGSAGS